MSYGNQPKMRDKLICASFYTAHFIPLISWVPIIWLVIVNVQKKHMRDFIKYHCYQAILFNMLMAFLPQLLTALINFTCTLLSMMVIFANSVTMLQSFNNWLINIYSMLIPFIALYAVIWTLRGKYTYMPPISQAINMMLR
ncbi:MAG: hypothetical protein O3C63_05020 [Cyanobacteria bacterium]|nr:hypothetical protein [Cyanobacteriota bacterium]